MQLAKLAVLAACVAVTSNSIAAPFQPQATQNQIDAYQAFASNDKCKSAIDCSAIFAPISGSRVVIVRVGCVISMKPSGAIGLAYIAIQGKNFSTPFSASTLTTIDGTTFHVINAETYLFVEKGEVPRVDVLAVTKPVEQLRCTISGYHA